MNKITQYSASLVAALLFSVVAQAEIKTKKVAPTAAAKTVETKKIAAEGLVKWTGFGVGKSHTGDIKVSKATVDMKGDELVGGEFEMDMKSLTADSKKLEGHLKTADFFDVEKFSTAKFKIKQVEAIKNAAAGSPTHKLIGDLTIKEKTLPHEILAIIKKDGTKMTATAETEIKDRTKFDIVYNSKQFQAISKLGDKLIEDNIKLNLVLTTK